MLIVISKIFCYNEIEGRLVCCLQREEVLGLPLTGCILGHILKRPRTYTQLSLVCLFFSVLHTLKSGDPAKLFPITHEYNNGAKDDLQL
jgi:hypothetical protein